MATARRGSRECLATGMPSPWQLAGDAGAESPRPPPCGAAPYRNRRECTAGRRAAKERFAIGVILGNDGRWANSLVVAEFARIQSRCRNATFGILREFRYIE